MRGLFFKEFGKPTAVLSFGTLTKPSIKNDQVLIKMLASPVNPSDVNQIEGVYPVKPFQDNDLFVPGNEGSGEIVQTGSDIKDLKEGDRVIFAAYAKGTWREYVSATRQQIFKIDPKLDPKYAAILSVNPCSAYRMLNDFGTNKVLIQNAANSNVGRMVIQMAKLQGIQTINIVRDREDITALKDELKGLGADFVFTEEELATRETSELIRELKPSLALNAVGGVSATNISKCLDENGQMVSYGAMGKQPIQLPVSLLIFKNIQFKGFWMTQWTKEHNYEEKREMIRKIAALVIEGKLQFPTTREYSLENYEQAFEKGDKAVFTF